MIKEIVHAVVDPIFERYVKARREVTMLTPMKQENPSELDKLTDRLNVITRMTYNYAKDYPEVTNAIINSMIESNNDNDDNCCGTNRVSLDDLDVYAKEYGFDSILDEDDEELTLREKILQKQDYSHFYTLR